MKNLYFIVSLSLLFISASCELAERNGRKVIAAEGAPKAIGPYSQGVLVNGTLYCAGQIGIDPSTGSMVEGGAAAEADRALINLGAVLDAAGMDYTHVVKATVFLVDIDDYAVVNEVYARYFPLHPPAREAVQVARLPKDAAVEISIIAVQPD